MEAAEDGDATGGGPRVRVGIVSWNTAEHLEACLKSLPAALEGTWAEIVVVDNASRDESVAVAESHGVAVIRNPINVGYAKAMNQALYQPWPEVLIALNPDTVPGPGSLTALVRHLVDGPDDVGLVAPVLKYPDNSVQHSVHRFPNPGIYLMAWLLPTVLQRGRLARRFWFEGRTPHDRSQDVDWVMGAVHVIRSAALDGRPDAYDDRWFMYVEDVELCWWLSNRHWRRILDASVVVTHVGNASGAQAWGDARVRRYMRESYDWYARDKGVWAARVWAASNVVGVIGFAGASSISRLVIGRPRSAVASIRLLREIPIHVRGVVAPLGVAPRPNGEN
jgi:N-acetylglucosaminyl-diphospho-decaprenol L-rhamnosyltransferase